MQESFIYRTDALVLATMLCCLMLLAIFLGLKMGKAGIRKQKDNQDKPDNSANGTIVASLFGLLGFLLAFTFGMSGSRFDNRRAAIINEANAIGTATLRADLYNDTIRALLRKDFKAYTEARIRYHEAGRDKQKMDLANQQADSLGALLWKRVSTLARDKDNLISSNQMIPALNEMLDNATLRNSGEQARVPDSIVIMLFVLSVACAFYVGYSSAEKKGRPDWFIVTGFCLLTSIVIYITLDLDRPRRGIIKVDSSHQSMLDLRKL